MGVAFADFLDVTQGHFEGKGRLGVDDIGGQVLEFQQGQQGAELGNAFLKSLLPV